MAASASIPPPWSELPVELLDLVIARLPYTRDRVRFRAVCRAWHSARPPRQLPWLVSKDHFMQRHYTNDNLYYIPGFDPTSKLPKFLSSAVRFVCAARVAVVRYRSRSKLWADFLFSKSFFPIYMDARCIGSTDGWLAIDTVDDEERHTYSLQNIFTKTKVSLPELEPVIGNVSKFFKIRKVLMRLTPDGLVAVMTNNWNYPVILVRPGKGLWLPKPQTAPFIHIIDIAFLGDKLYGITETEGLVSLQIAFNDHGMPMVTRVEHVIMSQIDADVWRVYGNEEEVELKRTTGDGMVGPDIRVVRSTDDHELSSDEVDMGMPYFVETRMCYFVESREKLLMVKRQVRIPKYREYCPVCFTRKVEVFEADVSAGTWVPVCGGLGGQALFVSRRFSKSIFACGEVQKDGIYFNDTYEVFNARSKNISEPEIHVNLHDSSWVFPPGFF